MSPNIAPAQIPAISLLLVLRSLDRSDVNLRYFEDKSFLSRSNLEKIPHHQANSPSDRTSFRSFSTASASELTARTPPKQPSSKCQHQSAMKVFYPTAALGLSCLALVTRSATANKSFKPPSSDMSGMGDMSGMAGMDLGSEKFSKIKTAANFGKAGGKIDVCPSGDCTDGQVINLAMSRLEELDAAGKVVSRAENFNTADGEWSEFAEQEFDGVAVMSTSYVSTLSVKKKGSVIGTPAFNLTASIFSANGTAMNGNQTVPVPAGGLKFTVSVAKWPFLNQTNTLRFAVKVKAKGKGKAPKDLATPEKKKRNGTEEIERLDLGEGMFMDAPSMAVLDDVDTAITASVVATAPGVEYVWVFPHFDNTLYYDPVMGSTDESATSTTNDTTPAPTTATPTPTPTTSSAASFTLSGVIATGILALACAIF